MTAVGSARVAVASLLAVAAAALAGGGLLLLGVRGADPALALAVVTAAGLVAVPVVGRALVRADRGSRLGWLLAVAGTATVVKLVLDAYARAAFVGGASLPHPAAAELVSSLATSGQLALAGLAPLLLTGRLPDGRWWRVCVVLTAAIMALSVAAAFGPKFSHFEGVRNPYGATGPWGTWLTGLSVPVFLGQNVVDVSAALGVGAAIRQLPATTTPATRRGLELLRRAAWLVAASFLACLVLGGSGAVGVAYAVEHGSLLVFAVCAWVVVRRFGLLDVRQVVERTVRYGLLTAAVVVVYVVVLVAVRRVVVGALPGALAVVVAALVALVLRDGVQRRVARLVWGPADDPAAALERLNSRLDAVARPHDVLDVTAVTLCESLRLTGVRVLDLHDAVLASSGEGPADGGVAYPLGFGGEPVGVLLLEPRKGDGVLSRRQRTLVLGVLPQLSAAVQAVAAGQALAASRRRLASLRDSERSRIRADLHDGLGPALAGIAWGIEQAGTALGADAPAARASLARLAAETRGVVGEVRRLVHDLVPTRLEEAGLVAALTHDAGSLGASVEVSEGCWDLPLTTAVEVAAYRIALEAVANADRHADAAHIAVRLTAPDAGTLVVEVSDDGRGLPAAGQAGIGMASMRQRATECGGSLVVGAAPDGGTVVRATLTVGGPGRTPGTSDAPRTPGSVPRRPSIDQPA